MKVVIVKDYQEMSKRAAEIFYDLMKAQEEVVFGLATGSTPLGLYKNLIELYRKGEISFQKVKAFNLDEYCGLSKEHPQSYYSFMRNNLYNEVDMMEENIFIPNGNTNDPKKASQDYNELLETVEMDLQILGIGSNGHIGFNEPGTHFDQETFVVQLTEETRLDNRRFFNNLEEVPKYAITMGIKNILKAKKILLLASGLNKAEAIRRLIEEEKNEDLPASALKDHPQTIIIVDQEAASLLKK